MAFNTVALRLTKDAARQVSLANPWVFERSITHSGEGAMGDVAVVFDHKRAFVGLGLYDPDSIIRTRLLTTRKETVSPQWIRDAVVQSMMLRLEHGFERGTESATTGYRLIHGENDHLGGLVIDKYHDHACIKIDTVAWLPHMDTVAEAIQQFDPSITQIVLRASNSVGIAQGRTLAGAKVNAPVRFREHGLWFLADLVHGQKTGFFLDQRDNRARVESLADGRRVLNVFAYNGGFSLYAMRGGAKHVTSIDISPHAIAQIEANLACNDLHAEHEAHATDAFDFLADAAKQKVTYDLVILDPPSFAHKNAQVPKALAAYQRLARMGAQITAPGGILVTASCSSRVATDDFIASVAQGIQQAGRSIERHQLHGHAPDHPVGFVFGNYLKTRFSWLD